MESKDTEQDQKTISGQGQHVVGENMDNNKPGVRTFEKCPCCGSDDLAVTGLVKEALERKLTQPGTEPSLQTLGASGVSMTSPMLIAGMRVPVVEVFTEVCCNCGCMFARKIEFRNGTVNAMPAPGAIQRGMGGAPQGLNRAMRRHPSG